MSPKAEKGSEKIGSRRALDLTQVQSKQGQGRRDAQQGGLLAVLVITVCLLISFANVKRSIIL